MGYFEDALENMDEQAIFLECILEEWPALPQMSEEDKQRLYREVRQALEAIACPVQAMKAFPDRCVVIVQMSMEQSVETATNAIDAAIQRAFPEQAEDQQPNTLSIYSMSPTDVIDAVVQLA